ncbi:MAG TPA: PepSY domain-containing protein [Acidimicrobiia bacterium]|nr:PepSY domain-containing protein [Acidimicrobiia bacterium]
MRAVPAEGTEPDDQVGGERQGPLRPILWRLHFFMGFLAAPVVVWLCLSGIAFAWNPQLESAIYDEALTATSRGQARPVSEQVAAAGRAYPGHEVVQVSPAAAPGETTGVMLKPPGARAVGFAPAPGAFTVYVDPASSTVTGRIFESRRPAEWLRNLHSNFRVGPWADTFTELAASLALVSLVSGLYLWWPKSRAALRRTFVPRLRGLRGGGRRPWRDLHASLGVLTLAALAVMLVTGLTWTDHAGRWVDVAKTALVADPPTLRTQLTGSSGGGGGSHGAHGPGGRTAAPATNWAEVDGVVASARRTGVNLPYIVTPPAQPGEAWSVAEVDNRWPIQSESVAIDPATGQVVDRLAFADNPLLEQATTVGIGFHEGTLFGLVNQIGLTLLAAALVGIVVSGYVMWWRRRPPGAFGAPPRPRRLLRTVPVPLLGGFVLLGVLLPTLAVGFVAYLVAERLLRRVRPVRSQAA